MKMITKTSIVVVALTISTLSALSMPIGGSMVEREHLIMGDNLPNWSAGLFFDSRERAVDVGIGELDYSSVAIMGYLGYDILEWMRTYVATGVKTTEIGSNSDPDGAAQFSLGTKINLLYHDLLSPSIHETSIRVDMSLQYSWSEIEYVKAESWSEFYGSLILHIIREVEASKIYWAEAVSIYGGPFISDFSTSGIDEKETFGVTGGVEIFLTKEISFNLGLQLFPDSDQSFAGGININF